MIFTFEPFWTKNGPKWAKIIFREFFNGNIRDQLPKFTINNKFYNNLTFLIGLF